MDKQTIDLLKGILWLIDEVGSLEDENPATAEQLDEALTEIYQMIEGVLEKGLRPPCEE